MGTDNKWYHNAVLSLSLLVSIGATSVEAAPAVFRDAQLTAAKAAAKQENKLLLIDFTASWCGPCHKMDSTTWSDAAVKKWIDENAVAIQIDVDKEHDTAAAMKIAAMPTVVVFDRKSDTKDFDRQVGYLTGPELLKWLEGVKKGETSLDMMKHEVEGSFGKGGVAEVEGRHKLGAALFRADRVDEAFEHYLWLWENMEKQDKSLSGVRVSFLARELEAFVKKSPAVKQKIIALRDAAETTNVMDFIVLNDILSDNQKTLSWFDKIKKDPKERAQLDRFAYRLEPMLITAGRWKDIAIMYPDPIAELNKREEFAKAMEKTMHGRMGNYDPFAQGVGRLYAAYLSAGRTADAKKVALAALKKQDSANIKRELVLYAIDAGQARKDQYEWTKGDQKLTDALKEALDAKSGKGKDSKDSKAKSQSQSQSSPKSTKSK